jgi:hypothetical protein
VREITYGQALSEALAECHRHGMFVDRRVKSGFSSVRSEMCFPKKDAAPTGLRLFVQSKSYKHFAPSALKTL